MTFGRAFSILACLFVPFPGAFVLMALAASSMRSDTRTLARALLSALGLLLLLLLLALRIGYAPSNGARRQQELPPRSSQLLQLLPLDAGAMVGECMKSSRRDRRGDGPSGRVNGLQLLGFPVALERLAQRDAAGAALRVGPKPQSSKVSAARAAAER